MFLLVICFIHISVYRSIPISQFIPPSPPPGSFFVTQNVYNKNGTAISEMVLLELSVRKNLHVNDQVTLLCVAGRNLRARCEASLYQLFGPSQPP